MENPPIASPTNGSHWSGPIAVFRFALTVVIRSRSFSVTVDHLPTFALLHV